MTKMGANDNLLFIKSTGTPLASVPNIVSEGRLLHPAVNARLFKSLEGRNLRVRESWFDSPFRERPSTTARSHQKKFDTAAADPVANRRNLFADALFANL